MLKNYLPGIYLLCRKTVNEEVKIFTISFLLIDFNCKSKN